MPEYNLFGIDDQDYKKAKVVVIPIPYDSTSTYKVGSREGPRAIIEASRSLEPYNEEIDGYVRDIGIYTTEELQPDFDSPKKTVERISREVSILMDDNKIPILLGGEHTIAVGAVKAFSERDDDFSVLHFDAHADSRDELFGTKYCHACVMARIREMCGSCYSVGVRSIDEDSAKKYSKSILYMKDMENMSPKEIADAIIKNTKKKIYMTVDFDVIDPSEMPSTGTPEPGGMKFRDIKEIIRIVMKKKELIGADFNELCPIQQAHAPNVLAAKLIYFTLASAFFR
jgi:agmatinase